MKPGESWQGDLPPKLFARILMPADFSLFPQTKNCPKQGRHQDTEYTMKNVSTKLHAALFVPSVFRKT
jgi:hypothetical protein